MDSTISKEDRERIEQGIRNKYKEVAGSPQGQFAYPTGKEGLRTLRYDPSILAPIPDEVASSYCGVGNPFSLRHRDLKLVTDILGNNDECRVELGIKNCVCGSEGKISKPMAASSKNTGSFFTRPSMT